MNRSDLKKISLIRLSEANILLKRRKYSGAYYLSGYAIECALKACIAKKIRKSEFPNKEAVNNSYTHDLIKLIRSAGLDIDLSNKISTDAAFGLNWNVVKDWSEESRYEFNSKPAAEDMYKAISNPLEGVLVWIKLYW